MLRRAESVQRSQSLYYALGAKKFVDLSIVLHVIVEIIIDYAMQTKNGPLAFLFSSLNSVSREMLFQAIQNLSVPSMGGNGPAFSTLRDRVSWQFMRCQMCGESATERSLVLLVQEARTATILTCTQCDQNMKMERVATRGGFLTGNSFILRGCDILVEKQFDASCAETLRRNINAVRTKVIKVATQKWTASPIASRTARRSIPLPDRRRRAPLAVSGGKARVIKCVEIAIVVAIPGSSSTYFHLCLPQATATKLVEAPSSADRIKLMLSSALNLRQHHILIHYLSTAVVDLEVQSHPRKNRTPLRTPPVLCTHAYGASRPHMRLLRCSACSGREA